MLDREDAWFHRREVDGSGFCRNDFLGNCTLQRQKEFWSIAYGKNKESAGCQRRSGCDHGGST